MTKRNYSLKIRNFISHLSGEEGCPRVILIEYTLGYFDFKSYFMESCLICIYFEFV